MVTERNVWPAPSQTPAAVNKHGRITTPSTRTCESAASLCFARRLWRALTVRKYVIGWAPIVLISPQVEGSVRRQIGRATQR
jgi:hypothetical protein